MPYLTRYPMSFIQSELVRLYLYDKNLELSAKEKFLHLKLT